MSTNRVRWWPVLVVGAAVLMWEPVAPLSVVTAQEGEETPPPKKAPPKKTPAKSTPSKSTAPKSAPPKSSKPKSEKPKTEKPKTEKSTGEKPQDEKTKDPTAKKSSAGKSAAGKGEGSKKADDAEVTPQLAMIDGAIADIDMTSLKKPDLQEVLIVRVDRLPDGRVQRMYWQVPPEKRRPAKKSTGDEPSTGDGPKSKTKSKSKSNDDDFPGWDDDIGLPLSPIQKKKEPPAEGEPQPTKPAGEPKAAPSKDQPQLNRVEMLEVKRITVAREIVYETKLGKTETEAKKREYARMKARDVKAWPRITRAGHAAAIRELKQFGAEVQKEFPNLVFYETNNFLFYSDIPPKQVNSYLKSLDAMYDYMCVTYGIKIGTNVWRGKAIVFTFLKQGPFSRFESKFMQSGAGGIAQGVCHPKEDGKVIISAWQGDDVLYFGQTLVHETSHGFTFRYKSPADFPSWVNEGMADIIGMHIVKYDGGTAQQERDAIMILKRIKTFGPNFFDGRIFGWQYGATVALNRYMMTKNKDAYVAFVRGIKEGQKWEDSLKEHFRCTTDQLVAQFGASIGVPDLQAE